MPNTRGPERSVRPIEYLLEQGVGFRCRTYSWAFPPKATRNNEFRIALLLFFIAERLETDCKVESSSSTLR